MVTVFATMFGLSLDADALSDYLKEKMGQQVMCRKRDGTQKIQPMSCYC